MLSKCAPVLMLFCTLIGSRTLGQNVEFLDQNWDEDTRQGFYTTSQGSRLLPYDWFVAIEVKESSELFTSQLTSLGFLANSKSPLNPDGLPVGFVLDKDWAGKRHLGLNCAACHTSQIKFVGANKVLQIDGGPTLADTWGLLSGISESLQATINDEAKWARFVGRMPQANPPSVEKRNLKEEVVEFTQYFKRFVEGSRSPHPWGRGRLDAFGMIFNRVSSIDLDIPTNLSPPDAPVSFPFLWGTSWENQVQWNGSAPNTNDIERLGRNIGEVLGVFAQADLEKASIFKPYYRSSARRVNQLRLENRLKKLWSPQWPKHLASLDETKITVGQQLFMNNCVHCHEIVPHGEQDRPVVVVMTPVSEVKTDPRMATNAASRISATGKLEGSRIPGLEPLPSRIATGALLQNVVRGALLSPFRDVDQSNFKLDESTSFNDVFQKLNSQRITEDDLNAFLEELKLSQEQVSDLVKQFEAKSLRYIRDLRVTSDQALELAASPTTPAVATTINRLLAYKGRPLDGIWATGPYLHNGSVPNLYEILLPASERTKKFYVGNIEFDSQKVGFSTSESIGTTLFDTSLPGNSNSGHDMYGNFTEEQRWALVEFMKTL